MKDFPQAFQNDQNDQVIPAHTAKSHDFSMRMVEFIL